MSGREWWPGDAVPKKQRPVAMTLLGGATVLVPTFRKFYEGTRASWAEVDRRLAVMAEGVP